MTLQESFQLSTPGFSSLSQIKSINFSCYYQVFVTCSSLTKNAWHASYTNFLCNIFTLSKGNISSISLWIISRLFVRNLHWWNKSSLNYQNIDLKSYKSLAWLKRRIQWERKNRKRASPVLKEELIGCETSVDVCESNQVTLGAMRGVFTSFFLRLCYRSRL